METVDEEFLGATLDFIDRAHEVYLRASGKRVWGQKTPRFVRYGALLKRHYPHAKFINVLRGEMSLIGPRPDSYDHARVYLRVVPGYQERHQIVPGISGFAQTEVGYVDGLDGIHRKVAADLHYIAHATLRFDLWITWRTLAVVVGQRGH